MKNLTLLIVITILSSISFADTFADKRNSISVSCSSSYRELYQAQRRIFADTSGLDWLGFSESSRLSMMSGYGHNMTMAIYAKTINSNIKSQKEISNCLKKSMSNIDRLMSIDFYSPLTHQSFTNEVMNVLTPCVCK